MTEYDGEPEFHAHAGDAAESIETALTELTQVRAYVLSESEMEQFKDAQMALRELYHGFESYSEGDHE